MARARNIKPRLFVNEALAEIGPLGQLLFAGLWTLADRAGRLEDRPKRIKAEIFPYYEAQVEDILNSLAKHDFVRRYVADGRRYIQITNFAKHQNPHINEKPSTIPAPCEHRASTVQDPESSELVGLIPDSLSPESPIPDIRTTDPRIPSPRSVSSLHPPQPLPQTVAAAAQHASTDSAPRGGSPKGRKEPLDTAATREAYRAAYADRYGVSPVLNVRVNSQIRQFVERLGVEEAPAVTAFYVRSNNGRYVASGHSVGMLLMDAEKLRTEWARGRSVTQTEVRLNDRTAARGNVFGALIAEVKDASHG